MKDYIRAFIFVLILICIIPICCILSHVFGIAEAFTIFLIRHIGIAIIITVLLLISYIKSVQRKMKR